MPDDDGTQPFGSNRLPFIREADFDTPAWREEMNAKYGDPVGLIADRRGIVRAEAAAIYRDVCESAAPAEFNADLNRWIVND